MAAGGEHGTKAVIAAMLANAAIAVAKLVAFLVTGASSLLAESIHSVADTGNQGLLLLGGRRAKRTADELHPFGYGRERYFWSFVVALVLFVLGAVFAIYEGIHKIEHPEPLENPIWAYGVLGFALVVEGLSFRTAVSEANEVRRRATWRQFIRNAKSPELPVVLLEDSGALAGLVIALAAITTSEVTGDPIWDGIGTLAIGILLAVIAVVLVVEMKSLLIGESASRKDVETIRAAVEIDPAVQRLIHMRTQHQGPEELLVGMKVELDHTLTFPEVSEVVNRIERNVRRAVPMARLMYIEPDVTDARRAAPTIGEHVPAHEVPEEIRAKRKLEEDRGALGAGIPVEDDL
ncbi:MAG TPA: cation diffusion facilitator family transporter [Iamia sp.]|nr:cation diffusion facilitator family transporter [Iamia sp.]